MHPIIRGTRYAAYLWHRARLRRDLNPEAWRAATGIAGILATMLAAVLVLLLAVES